MVHMLNIKKQFDRIRALKVEFEITGMIEDLEKQ